MADPTPRETLPQTSQPNPPYNPNNTPNTGIQYPLYLDPITPTFYRQSQTHTPPYYIPDISPATLQQMQLQMLHLTHPNNPQPNHTTTTTHPLPSTQPLHHRLPPVPDAQMASAYRIGRYTPAERKIRLERYREKRAQRNYNRRVKYDCRKQIADKRRRVQGRFVKREEEIALAASDIRNNSDAEDETKLQQPDSSASASSVRHVDTDNRKRDSFCDQSEHVLETFR